MDVALVPDEVLMHPVTGPRILLAPDLALRYGERTYSPCAAQVADLLGAISRGDGAAIDVVDIRSGNVPPAVLEGAVAAAVDGHVR